MASVITTGELLIDFTPVYSEGHPGALCPNPGGAPANVAVQLSRLGISAGFIGKVGKDSFGASLRECLVENGVDVSGLAVDPETPTTLAFVQLDKNGDRSFTFYRSPGADTQLREDEVDMAAVADCSVLHFGSLSLTTDPGRTTTLNMVKKAKEMGKLISYDPNWRPPLWKSQETGVRWMKTGLEYCDLVKISEEELAMLTGTDSIREGVERIHGMGPAVAVVTLGPDGCVFSNGRDIRHQPTFDTPVADTTGSGDSFWGAFLSRLVKGGAVTREALSELDMDTLSGYCRFANGAGSICAASLGGIPALKGEEEILACMRDCPVLDRGFKLK